MAHRQKGEIATILAVSALIALGVATVASSFFVNKNTATTSTRASAVGTCVEYPSGSGYPGIESGGGYKWKSYCGLGACTANDYAEKKANSQCNQKLAGEIAALGLPADHPTWCYGFSSGGATSSTADWRCMLLIPPPASAPPPVNNPPPQQPPATSQLCLRPPKGGAQPNCTDFTNRNALVVLGDGPEYAWKVSNCTSKCSNSGSGEWCYGFNDGNYLLKYEGALNKCSSIENIQAAPPPVSSAPQLPPQEQPISNPPQQSQQPINQPQDPIVDPDENDPPEVDPQPEGEQLPKTPGTTQNACEKNGYLCLRPQERQNDYPTYETKSFACSTTGENCYGPKPSQAPPKQQNACQQAGGTCTEECLGNTSKSPNNQENLACGGFICCKPKTAPPATVDYDKMCKDDGGDYRADSCGTDEMVGTPRGDKGYGGKNCCKKKSQPQNNEPLGPPVPSPSTVSTAPFTIKIKADIYPSNKNLFNLVSNNGDRIEGQLISKQGSGCFRFGARRKFNTATQEFIFDVFPQGENSFGRCKESSFDLKIYFYPINEDAILLDEVKGNSSYVVKQEDVKKGGAKTYNYPRTLDIDGFNKHFSYQIKNTSTKYHLYVTDIDVSVNYGNIKVDGVTTGTKFDLAKGQTKSGTIDLYGYLDSSNKSNFIITVHYMMCTAKGNCQGALSSSKNVNINGGYNFKFDIGL